MSVRRGVLGLARIHLTLLSFTFLLVPQIKYPHVSSLLFAVRGRSNILSVGMKPGYLSFLPAVSMNSLSLLSSVLLI